MGDWWAGITAHLTEEYTDVRNTRNIFGLLAGVLLLGAYFALGQETRPPWPPRPVAPPELKNFTYPRPKAPAAAPFDYVEWGSTIYPGWLAVDQATVALTETAPLLLTRGRRCQNGRPVPVDRADWKQYVKDLVEVSMLAHRTSQARDYDAFVDVSEKLNDACANCHKVYRDKGGTEGSGATRCQPVP